MWVFTTSGFVSAVYKDDALQVRARDKKSLQALSKQTGAAITKDQVAAWVTQQALAVDYKNFKSEVADLRGYNFASPLNKVWSAMHDVEDAEARVR